MLLIQIWCKFPFNLCDMFPNTHHYIKKHFKKSVEYMEYFVENRQDLRNRH